MAENRPEVGPLLSEVELLQVKTYTDLSEALVNPDSVYKLSLTKQDLDEFPLEILLFKNLQILNLSRNKIDSLPPEIGYLQNLQELNLMANRLNELPRTMGELQNLRSLYLSRNRLHMFPPEMRSLQGLKFMDITYNDWLTYEIEWIEKVLPKTTIKW